MMKLVNLFSLMAIDNVADTPEQCHSVLLINGNDTGVIIYGAVLEASVQVDTARYLLFLTDGLLFENGLTICLFDALEGVLDEVRLVAAYTDGYFENLKISSDSVSFDFFGTLKWTVRVLKTPVVRLPLINPFGVYRHFRLKTFLQIGHESG
ncbi:hypothetical protein CDR68_17095 [Salmonella enterica]|nr:hypothetical protein [Salmonella enterica]